jgi:hypothetical protein
MTSRLIAFNYTSTPDPPGLPSHDVIPTVKWGGVLGVDSGVWVAIALVTSAGVNLLKVKVRRYFTFANLLYLRLTVRAVYQWYGRCEYLFGVFKLISLVILILAQIPINTVGKGMFSEFVFMNDH